MKPNSTEVIQDINKQTSLFKHLMSLTNNAVLAEFRKDSLSFLILPVQASCPSCRKKTIDSIIVYGSNLPSHHFIIISANAGYKTINAYFRDENSEIPHVKNRLFIDSLNKANTYELYDKKPTFYYTADEKVYKRVSAVPSTIREDLREFFSGHRKKS
jgi:hypothetical protein